MKKKVPKKKSEEWFGCDNCPICQAMQNGTASTSAGLKKAFKKAKKQNKLRMALQPANKDDLYYDAMDALEMKDYTTTKRFLKEAQRLDPDYVQTYIGFVHLYGALKRLKQAHKNIILAFEKTQKLFPKWPRKMEWGYLENRAYLRAIHYRAVLYADTQNNQEATKLYKLLLKLNPNDNQGIRYLIAGLYSGLTGKQIDKLFDQANKKGVWDILEKLVEVQNKRHTFWKESKIR